MSEKQSLNNKTIDECESIRLLKKKNKSLLRQKISMFGGATATRGQLICSAYQAIQLIKNGGKNKVIK
jgi:hypothetical protein